MKRVLLLLVVVTLLGAQTLEERVEGMAESLTDNAASLISSGIISNAGCKGGLPHFGIGAGMNMAWFEFQNPITSGKVNFPAFFPFFYGEVGIFPGFSFTPAFRGILAIDILGKYAPALVKSDYFEELPYLLSYGVKVQLLKDQLIPPTPALSVALMKNTYKGLTLNFEDTLNTNLRLEDLSIRASVSKNIIFVAPYLGASYDTYSMKTTFWTTGDPTPKTIADIKKDAISYFAGLEFKILMIKGYLEGVYRNKRYGITLGVKAGI